MRDLLKNYAEKYCNDFEKVNIAIDALPDDVLIVIRNIIFDAIENSHNRVYGSVVSLNDINIETLESTFGIIVEHYAKCCHVGSDSATIKLSLKELLLEPEKSEEKFRLEIAAQRAQKEEKNRAMLEAQQKARIAALPVPY